MTIISLVTDFGTEDGNVGVMKGVIWGIAPEVEIADLSHQVAPQNIRQAAFILERHAYYFPEGSIHVVVVDPGVGTERRPIAARVGGHYFVGPDNGVFTLVYERAEKEGGEIDVLHTDKSKYWLPKISHIFHGRDIFSPVAAHLAAGVPLEDLGTPIDEPVRIPLPHPAPSEKGWQGEVVYIDHFGNVATNLHRDHLADLGDVNVTLSGISLEGLVNAFGERPPGELVALYSSTDYLIVAEVNGNAAKRIGSQVGDSVRVSPRSN